MENLSGQAGVNRLSLRPLQAAQEPPKQEAGTQAASPRQAVQQALSQDAPSMKALSARVIQAACASKPLIQQRIADFQQRFPVHIDAVNTQSWNQLKTQLGDDMLKPYPGTDSSMEQFRGAANDEIAAIVTELAQELGLPDATWSACGTVGYNSDVDTALLPTGGGRMSIEDAVTYKALRDCVHTHLIGGLSGVQLDTESYVQHPGQLDFGRFLTSRLAQRTFQAGEKASIIIQRHVSLARHPKDYEASKNRDLDSIACTWERDAMAALYGQVEAMMDMLEGKIEDKMLEQNGQASPRGTNPSSRSALCRGIRAQNPRAYKEAREAVMVPLRMQLGAMCAELQKDISAQERLLHSEMTRPAAEQRIDDLYLELHCCFMVVNLLQDEGTNSVAEGKVTLFQEGGQIHAGEQKKTKASLRLARSGSADALKRSPHARKHSTDALRSSLRNSQQLFNMAIMEDASKELGKTFEKPSGRDLVLAAYEEAAQLEHVILDGLHAGKDPGDVAIEAGKYALRCAGNLLRGLEAFKESLQERDGKTPPEFGNLLLQATRLTEVATQLERCKRKQRISTDMAVKMLCDVAMRGLQRHGGGADEITIRGRLNGAFSDFRRGGKYAEHPPEEERHVAILADRLERLQGLHLLDPNDPALRQEAIHILQAHAGHDRTSDEYGHLDKIHQEAGAPTTASLGLDSRDGLMTFFNRLRGLGERVRNMAREEDLMTTSQPGMAGLFDFCDTINYAEQRFGNRN